LLLDLNQVAIFIPKLNKRM